MKEYTPSNDPPEVIDQRIRELEARSQELAEWPDPDEIKD